MRGEVEKEVNSGCPEGKMGFYPINHEALEEGELLEVAGDQVQLW